MANKEKGFKPGPIFLEDEKPSPDQAALELEDMIEYSTLVIKVKGEDNPRCFDLGNEPQLRNSILLLLI